MNAIVRKYDGKTGRTEVIIEVHPEGEVMSTDKGYITVRIGNNSVVLDRFHFDRHIRDLAEAHDLAWPKGEQVGVAELGKTT